MPKDPFKVLIATILSQRTRDENTRKAAEGLFSRYKNAEQVSDAPVEEIERLIKPAGFYRQKAGKIKEVAGIVAKDGVPRDFEGLMALPGVGRKTANCVLVYAYGIPAIPVDTHVHRLANKFGLVDTTRPEETEAGLQKVLPREYWIEINDLLVRFGQNICRPVGPRCETCPFDCPKRPSSS